MSADIVAVFLVQTMLPLFSVVAGVVFSIGFGLTLIRVISNALSEDSDV
jgi:hypothetical protein